MRGSACLQQASTVGRKLSAATAIGIDPNTAVTQSVGAATANAGVSGLPTVTVNITDRSCVLETYDSVA